MAIQELKTYTRVESFRPILSSYQKETINSWFKRAEGKDIEIIQKVVRLSISDKQRKYYFGVIVPLLMDCMGNKNIEWAHFDIKQTIMPAVVPTRIMQAPHPWTGQMQDIHFYFPEEGEPGRLSINQMNTMKTEEFLELTRNWGLDFFNCVIPLPNEYQSMDNNNANS